MSTSKSELFSPSADLSGPAKLEEVTRLLDLITENLITHSLSPSQQDLYLETLKIYGRDPANSDPIYTLKGIKTLACYAFKCLSSTTSQIALKCIANAMLLKAETRQLFLDLGFAGDTCMMLRNDSKDYQFLASRILFLCTYGTKVDLEELISRYDLARNICHTIKKQADQLENGINVIEKRSMEETAFVETLKLMFNVGSFCPQKISEFTPAIENLILILEKQPIPDINPLDIPISSIINALLVLDFDKNSLKLFPKDRSSDLINYCVDVLEKSINFYSDKELEDLLIALIIVIRKVNDAAPPEIQKKLQLLLLPSLEDRKEILGRSNSVSSKLLRRLTNPLTPKLQESLSLLFFELSERDPKKLIDNIGYGYAAGFLHNHPLKEGEGFFDVRAVENENKNQQELSAKSNPVTGQLLEKEPEKPITDMTEEEKEREAERLFVLFDRLEKNGLIKVQNPLKTMNDSYRPDVRDD